MSISFDLATLENYIRQNDSKVTNEQIECLRSIFAYCNDPANGGIADDVISGREVEEFQRQGMSELPELLDIMKKFFQSLAPEQVKNPQEMTPSELAEDKKHLEQKVKDTYTKARDELVRRLENGSLTFTNPKTGEPVPAANLIKYFNKIDENNDSLQFYENDYGAAEAKADEGIILVNTTPVNENINILFSFQWNFSETEVMKILLHEALHIEYNKMGLSPGFDTQEEEMYVESQAIKLTSQIMQDSNGDIKDAQIYGEPISKLGSDDELLTKVLDERFIKAGYANRPKNASGDVNLFGTEIKNGNVVKIAGKEIGVTGAPSEGKILLESFVDGEIIANGILSGKILTSPPEKQPYQDIEVFNENNEKIFSGYYIVPKQNSPQKPSFGL